MLAEQSTTLGAILAADGGSIKTGPFGTVLKAHEYSKSGVPLISVGEIGYGQFHVHESTPRISDEVVRRLSDFVLRDGDIVFARKGAVDRSARISAEQEGWFLGSDGIRLRLPQVVDSRFMSYQLQSDSVRRWILQHATGTTMASLNQRVIERIPVVLPPKRSQRAIARILGALDDKIELNRRMNETLEAMARALFKSWFVDFDPVRAKLRGGAPAGMDAATAALFASRLVQTEHGEIPEGWMVERLPHWVDVLSGGTPSKSDPSLWNGSLKWISPKAMMMIHADECDDHVTFEALGNGTRLAVKGSTLVMVRGMGLHDGLRVSQAREDVTFNQDVKALVPRRIHADLLLFALLDAQESLHKRVESSGHGTGKMPSDILLAHTIVMPSEPIQQALGAHIAAINDRIALNRIESRTLATTRDLLLPKLLSGEVRVPEAERAVAEVA